MIKSAKILVNPSARSIVVAVKRVAISAAEAGLLQTEASVHRFSLI